MKKRSLGKMILLTIVTLGIYQFYWTYKTRQELVSQNTQVPPFKLLLLPFLVLIALGVVQGVVHAVAGSSSADSVGKTLNILSILLGALAVIAIIPIVLYWYYKYCKAAEKVTHGELTMGLSYGLFIGLSIFSVGFIWPFIMQSSFNKVVDSNTPVPDPAYPQPVSDVPPQTSAPTDTVPPQQQPPAPQVPQPPQDQQPPQSV